MNEVAVSCCSRNFFQTVKNDVDTFALLNVIYRLTFRHEAQCGIKLFNNVKKKN